MPVYCSKNRSKSNMIHRQNDFLESVDNQLEDRSRYPDIRQAFWLLVYLYLLLVGLLAISTVLAGVVGVELLDHPLPITGIYLTATLSALLLGIRNARRPLRETFPLKPVRASLLMAMTIALLGGVIIISEVNNLIFYFFPMPEWRIAGYLRLIGAQGHFWAYFFLVAALAPVAEEFLFRGLILRGFLANYSAKKAIVASAVIFAVFHLDPWNLFAAGALGLFFAWWMVKTGSLIPGLLAHALNNALPFIIIWSLGEEITGFVTTDIAVPTFHPISLDIVGLLLFSFGMWLSRILLARDGNSAARGL